ncbi:MAG: AsmA-like C-terminal domain-containing protein, partial [Parvibaculum sp.]|nr:AsmA-like C-terminal domain-containing protein [Parvibaculum sp.]
KAHIENASIPKIRENLSLTGGTLDLTVSRTSLTAKGPVVLNEAARVDLEWKEDFRRDVTPGSVYRMRGEVNDAARSAVGLELGQFVSGPVLVDATIMGNGRNVDRASVKADLTAAVAKLDDAAWQKEPGVAATTSFDVFLQEDGGYRLSNFSLSGDGIAAEGTFTVGNGGRLVAANFPSVRLGPDNDFSFVAGPAENAALEMILRGPRFDVRGVLGNLFSGSGDERPEQDRAEDVPVLEDVPVTDPVRRTAVRADIGTAIGNHGTSFNDVRVDMVQIDGDLWSMDVSATPVGGDPLSLTVGPDDQGVRRLKMVSNDAGVVFRALDFTRSIRGGKLNVDGVYDESVAGSPLRGALTIDDFRIVDGPVLANILTLGSLTGIGDTLRGDGILFVGLEMPFVMTKNRIHLKAGRMSGPAIGLTMDGQIDRATDVIDMEGTLVPAYTINSFLGKVPLLGPLIVGREGEGIFAITYSVRGRSDDPTVVVNPLSAIAPGFLRRIFEFGESMPPESQTPAESPENNVPAAEAPADSDPAAAPATPETDAAGAPATQKN